MKRRLDLDAPHGEYEIDAFGAQSTAQAIRAAINARLAESFLDDQQMFDEMSHDNEIREDAVRLLNALDDIKVAADSAIKLPWDIAPLLAPDATAVDALAAEDEFEANIEIVDAKLQAARTAVDAATKAIAAVMSFPVPPRRRRGNRDRSTEQAFVRAMARVWIVAIGKKIGRSASGPFVRFAAGAWRDLGMPTLADPEATLGKIAEKLPRTPRKK
jgi:hypothetical protein